MYMSSLGCRLKMALGKIEMAILINGKRLNNIGYAYDTVIFTDNHEGLQKLITRVAEVRKNNGLEFNIRKTQYMVISKHSVKL